MQKRLLSAVLAFGLALACLGDTGPASDPSIEPPNLQSHKQQLRAYIDSGGYAKDVAAVALKANKYLVKRIAKGAKPGKKLAIVFDIDETMLSNLPQILANDYGYVPKTWDTWVVGGQAHAIIPVQTVYDTAVRGKIDVFFITGRTESDRAATEKNLHEVGYETWTGIYYKQSGDPARSLAEFKTGIRRKLMQDGYVIVANIGDQVSDFVGGYAERNFKLPNPFYISN
jgi:5'-nucleotidase (lipoprotein e(P4) family)